MAKDLYLRSERRFFRNPKQIRERWLNHLDPQICKSDWTAREDHMIVSAVLEKGKKWAQIAKLGGGLRTEHMVKNRYYALLRHEEKSSRQEHDGETITKRIKRKLEKTLRNDSTQAGQVMATAQQLPCA